jgi:hypothetical protein
MPNSLRFLSFRSVGQHIPVKQGTVRTLYPMPRMSPPAVKAVRMQRKNKSRA